MSEKEYKGKCERLFKKNTILINENEQLKAKIKHIENICSQYVSNELAYKIKEIIMNL